MLLPVVPDSVNAAVLSIGSKIRDRDLGARTSDECLQFRLIEHAEPRRGNDRAETAEECGGLEVGLALKAVAGYIGDVDEAVFVCDGN